MDRDQSELTPQSGDNITRFKRDIRITVAGALRTLGLLIMLGVVVFTVFTYSDELNVDNLKRLLSYAQASASGQGEFTAYTFEPGLDTIYAPFELGLAVVSSDTYRFATGFGVAGFSAQLGYTSPAMLTSQRHVLIYDRGNTGYCLANSYSVLHQGQSDSAIIAATMNRQGDYLLVKEESGYRAGVYVYDYKNRETCVWQTPSTYVMLPTLSPEGDRFGVVCLSERSGSVSQQVRVYTIGREEPDFKLEFGERQIYALRHDKNGTLFILCEDGLFTFDPEGNELSAFRFTGLTYFAHHEGDLPMVALRVMSGSGERVRLIAFGADGQPAWETQVAGSLRDLDFRGGYGTALFYEELATVDLTGDTPSFARRAVSGVRRALCTDDGYGLLVYSDRAERFTLLEEPPAAEPASGSEPATDSGSEPAPEAGPASGSEPTTDSGSEPAPIVGSPPDSKSVPASGSEPASGSVPASNAHGGQ